MIMYLVHGMRGLSQFDELIQQLGEERYRQCSKWKSFVEYQYLLTDALAVDIELTDEELVWIKLRYSNVIIEDGRPLFTDNTMMMPWNRSRSYP